MSWKRGAALIVLLVSMLLGALNSTSRPSSAFASLRALSHPLSALRNFVRPAPKPAAAAHSTSAAAAAAGEPLAAMAPASPIRHIPASGLAISKPTW